MDRTGHKVKKIVMATTVVFSDGANSYPNCIPEQEISQPGESHEEDYLVG